MSFSQEEERNTLNNNAGHTEDLVLASQHVAVCHKKKRYGVTVNCKKKWPPHVLSFPL